MRLPVAIQFYSVRDESEKDFFGTLQKIKDMGYEGVEFAGLYGHSYEEVRDRCKVIGIVPVSAHVSIDELLSDPEGVIGGYRTIGCDYIAIPWMPEERRPGHPGFEKTVEDICDLGKICGKYGITLQYHNHDFEFERVDGKYILDILYDTVPAELLETQLDLCWVNVGGEDPAAYLLKYSGRAPTVHLKDFVMKSREKPQKLYELIGVDDDTATADEEDFSYMPIGYGVQDIPALLKAAVQAGAQWIIVEEDEPEKGNTSLNAAKMSIETLKQLNR